MAFWRTGCLKNYKKRVPACLERFFLASNFFIGHSLKYDGYKYNITFVPVAGEKIVEADIKGKGLEIEKLISGFKKDISDIKFIIFTDVCMLGPFGTVKITHDFKIEFIE